MLLLLARSMPAVDPAHAAQGDCGQPLSSGAAPVATDALFALSAAVGTANCDPCICNVDSSTGGNLVSATDALLILARAVNPTIVLTCPPCLVDCDDSAAPQCGGSCPNDGICAEPILDPGTCRCLTPCELSDVAACAGECEEPDELCLAVETVIATSPPTSGCACIPPGIRPCIDASGPDCEGVCHPGAGCEATGGGCACVDQPLPPPCAEADAPTCAGRCGEGEICQPNETACDCVPWTGQFETCEEEIAPICGGICADGRGCVIDIGEDGCFCATACETSVASACGGECDDPDETCSSYSVTLPGASPVDFCACLRTQP